MGSALTRGSCIVRRSALKSGGRVCQRCARYTAGVVFLAGLGVVYLVGALSGTPLRRLWIPLFWGGVASLLLGWAVGHAAGRLFKEVTGNSRTVSTSTDTVEEKN